MNRSQKMARCLCARLHTHHHSCMRLSPSPTDMFHHLTMRPIELLFVPVTHPSDLAGRLPVCYSRTARLRCRREVQVSETVGVATLRRAQEVLRYLDFCDRPTRASASKFVISFHNTTHLTSHPLSSNTTRLLLCFPPN